jgi:hypothetical protein
MLFRVSRLITNGLVTIKTIQDDNIWFSAVLKPHRMRKKLI